MSPRHHGWPIAATIGTLVVVLGIAAASSGWVRRQIRLSVTRAPSHYTELYFTDPENLPAHLPVATTVPVNFTIADHEGTAVSYRYDVIASAPNVAPLSLHGYTIVASGQVGDVAVPLHAARAGLPYTVTVLLPGYGETIHFHVPSSK